MGDCLTDLLNKKIIILDGATGTSLQAAGMPLEVCAEQWIIDHEEALIDLQRAYMDAGSDIVYAPTFSGNRIKLKEYGLEAEADEINRALVAISKKAVGNGALVAGDLTMTGQQLKPLGPVSFDELIACYKAQAKAIYESGADLFVIETMMSVQETRAAVLAVQSVCDLPVMATLTFEPNGRTLFGTDPVTALITLQNLGVAAFGINCSCGPDAMLEPIRRMRSYAKVPLIAKPNAGMPAFVDGKTVYPMAREAFAKHMAALVDAGASIVGGCCGTTPAHIRALSTLVKDKKPIYPDGQDDFAATSMRNTFIFENGAESLNIDERVCASENPELEDELSDGIFDTFYDLLDEAADDGAQVICIDVDSEEYDVKRMIDALLDEIGGVNALPVLSSNNREAIERFLHLYPGRTWIKYKEGIDEAWLEGCLSRYGAKLIR